MEQYARQQFELMLQDAVGRFAERLVYRCGGPDAALDRLAQDQDGPGTHRTDFVKAFLAENLLDNTAGHCFVLEALEQRVLPEDPGGPGTDVLGRLARAVFADVLTAMTSQLIQRQQIHGSMP